MQSLESPPTAELPVTDSRRRWLVLGGLGIAAVFSLTAWFLSEMHRVRITSQDKSVSTYQIRAAVDQFFMENPTRLFVRYDEIIGPTRYVKSVTPTAGENYHELFPLRRSPDEYTTTMGDGRRVILFENGVVRQRPDGELSPRENRPDMLQAYDQLRQELRRPDGPQVIVRPKEFRLETNFRDGVPDGPFRYYLPDGKLWGEGSYSRGRVLGIYREYDSQGRILYEANASAASN